MVGGNRHLCAISSAGLAHGLAHLAPATTFFGEVMFRFTMAKGGRLSRQARVDCRHSV
jgi:hypothetical protein